MPNHGHSCEGDHDHDDTPETGVQYSLYQKIDKDNLECLNEAEDGSGRNVFKPWEERLNFDQWVESDADEELLFNIPFTGNIKLKGIIVIGENSECHPSRLRIYSCGYKKAFDDYAGIIQQKYPEISVIGGNYDPPGFNMHLSRLIGLGKIVIIMCILRGVNILGFLNKPQPSWWTWCVENKVYACMMLFFLANMIEGQLVSSGAFEISLNNIPLWSKLETGRIPQPPELFQIIDNTLAFTKSENFNVNFNN